MSVVMRSPNPQTPNLKAATLPFNHLHELLGAKATEFP